MDAASSVASGITALLEDCANMNIYEPLSAEEDSTRLLLLEPSEHKEDEICCHLRPVKVNGDSLTLHNGIGISYKLKYEAISYTWGSPLSTQRIVVNHHEVCVRSNLHDCLKRLRNPDGIRLLWIDAVCINQDDNAEKSCQVRMMASIYNNAERVIAWLGESADGSDELFSCINGLNQHGSRWAPNEKGKYIPNDEFLERRDRLLQRPYWNRTWIIQELHMAREVVFQSGDSQATRTRFSRIFEDVWTNGFMTERDFQVKALIEGQKLFDINDTLLIDSHLPALIIKYGRTNCLDERDKVYALLSILPENDRARSLKIDYSLTAAQLYAQIFDLLKFDWPGNAWGEADALRHALRLEWSQIAATWNKINPKNRFPWRVLPKPKTHEADDAEPVFCSWDEENNIQYIDTELADALLENSEAGERAHLAYHNMSVDLKKGGPGQRGWHEMPSEK